MESTVVQGDIAQQSADVLVNAAGTSLEMGSGVAGALREVAGETLNETVVAKGPIDFGTVVATDAFGLDADHVVHAAAMPHFGDGRATDQSIHDATRNTLELADEFGAESPVVPALGCGVAGFETSEGARLICRVIDGYEPDSLRDVHLIAHSDEEYETISRVANEVLDRR